MSEISTLCEEAKDCARIGMWYDADQTLTDVHQALFDKYHDDENEETNARFNQLQTYCAEADAAQEDRDYYSYAAALDGLVDALGDAEDEDEGYEDVGT